MNRQGDVLVYMPYREHYSAADDKTEKSSVASLIICSVRNASPQGGFVRCIDGSWLEVAQLTDACDMSVSFVSSLILVVTAFVAAFLTVHSVHSRL